MAPPQEFCQPPKKPFDIAVVGGGIAGLTLTLHLLLQGIPTTLYEQASQFGEIGAGVSVGPNASRAMNLISPHIRKGFENRATSNQWEENKGVWFDFRYGESCGGKREEGSLICRLECEGGQQSVHRAHFLDELVKLLPDNVAQFDKRVEDYQQDENGVLLEFHDGTTARHDAVIACDGIKSKVRRVLLGEDHPAAKAVFSGKYAYRGLIPMAEAEQLLGEELAKNSQMYFGRHGHVLTFSIEKGKTMNVVAFHSADEWKSSNWVLPVEKEDVLRDFEGWGDSVQSILKLMQKPDVWALFNHPPAPTYYKGRVCLLGDAAHASTPHKGAGAGMCIEDAYILGSLLGDLSDAKDIESAFSVYNQIRKERSQKLVEDSRGQAQVYEMEVESTGDDPKKIAENLSTRMDWVWNHDHVKELNEARELLRKTVSA
ncbi:putative mannitol 1-phosphate dehydrogenase [Phaeomoniella chlamydospora]|uniref:Putative mannitol 1-phosphate dehydrogenase n=1 Tax=Phaeomoniella chlamydospora TaxID=158046 RepID=A0A0G2F0Q2_PHACM|nr:putative mannitol 1-phosphate dehydrogenase [Phaeomoniella chlamydospora]